MLNAEAKSPLLARLRVPGFVLATWFLIDQPAATMYLCELLTWAAEQSHLGQPIRM